MKTLLSLVLLLLPVLAFAVCHVEEYQDHYVATCIGDPTPAVGGGGAAGPTVTQTPEPVQEHTFAALEKAQEQQGSEDAPIDLNDNTLRYYEQWLKTQPPR